MSTRGKLRFGGKTYGIWHDAHPNPFGKDLLRVVQKRTRTFQWLTDEYDLTPGEAPKGVQVDYEYKVVGRSAYFRDHLYNPKTGRWSWTSWKRLSEASLRAWAQQD
jgi:hypothetical protein